MANWRAWVLIVLFLLPTLIYVGLGGLWLAQHRGPMGFPGELLLYGVLLWVSTGIAFAILLKKWTDQERQLLPPIDWDRPATFNERDLEAWKIVQTEAEQADTLPMDVLLSFDTFEKTGLTLARRLSQHYRPESGHPVDHVAVVEVLTALQLAAEDLVYLCREIPGGDMITPAHLKKAQQAANYVQRASDFYNMMLPVFQPLTGLARFGVQKLVVQPAWRGMQRNLLRWFFRAYLNRLGHHLIELYSGRLAVGADTYRKLTGSDRTDEVIEAAERPLEIAIVGARGAGKTALAGSLQRTLETDRAGVRKRIEDAGFDADLAERLETARVIEVPGWPGAGDPDAESLRRRNVESATGADLLLLVADAASSMEAEREWLDAWASLQRERGFHELPPVLGVLTHADRFELGTGWSPPYDWNTGRRPREQAVRQRLDSMRKTLEPTLVDAVAVGLPEGAEFGVAEAIVPELAALMHRAERVALLRLLGERASRSRAGRVLSQIGRHGKRLWRGLRDRRPSRKL